MTEKEALGIWLPLLINSYEPTSQFREAVLMAYNALAEKTDRTEVIEKKCPKCGADMRGE